jgi:hypothetical protein
VNRLQPLLVIAALLAVLAWSGLRSVAALHYRAASELTEEMLDAGGSNSAGIGAAAGRLGQAMRWFPEHPDYLDLAGNLQELQARQPGVVGRARREALQRAADHYRAALAARPLWPHSWANLLAVKDQLGAVDDEFMLALTRSAETGPWTPRVQLQVMESGLRHWDRLPAGGQDVVRDKVADALVIQPRKVFEIVRNYAMPELVCGVESGHRAIERWCETVLPGDESAG